MEKQTVVSVSMKYYLAIKRKTTNTPNMDEIWQKAANTRIQTIGLYSKPNKTDLW